jgi:hypothetical protein
MNDRVVVITLNEMRQAIARKIAAEVASCLRNYAEDSLGRYPWATDNSFDNDVDLLQAGRLPDRKQKTAATSGGIMIDAVFGNTGAGTQYPCRVGSNQSNGWYKKNWQQYVFYVVSPRHKPGATDLKVGSYSTACRSVSGSDCISVDGKRNYEALVIVSGAALAGQVHPSNIESNYLDGVNATQFAAAKTNPSGATYEFTRSNPASPSTFNDVIATIP